MTEGVAVKLTDQEWRVKCEELAKAELRRKAKRDQLDAESKEFSDRKKDLGGQIDTLTEQIEVLAREVDTHEAMVDPQGSLPLAGGSGDDDDDEEDDDEDDDEEAEARAAQDRADADVAEAESAGKK